MGIEGEAEAELGNLQCLNFTKNGLDNIDQVPGISELVLDFLTRDEKEAV